MTDHGNFKVMLLKLSKKDFYKVVMDQGNFFYIEDVDLKLTDI